MRKPLVPLLLLLLLLSGCSQLPFTLDAAGHQARLSNQQLARSPYNQFGFDLLRTLPLEENVLISPISIALALAMAQNGADGDTAREMAEALRVTGIALEELNQSNADLQAKLQDADVTLQIANSLWLSRGVRFRQQFIDDNRAFYDAEVSEVDFAQLTTADTINAWVKEKTNDLIEKIISRTDPSTLACLVNAIYFHGEWQQPFDPELTQAGVFHTPDGELQAQFMQRSGLFDYLEGKDLQAIRLPYGEGRMAMYVFLPQDLDQFCRQLTAVQWQRLLKGFEQAPGKLALPKFKFGYEQELKDELQVLGMRKAFSGDADFSRMTDEAMWISKVLHKAVIEVDETGTEAAAVTAVIACGGLPEAPFTMTVDRPFLFVIHDRETDAILFIGTVQDPS